MGRLSGRWRVPPRLARVGMLMAVLAGSSPSWLVAARSSGDFGSLQCRADGARGGEAPRAQFAGQDAGVVVPAAAAVAVAVARPVSVAKSTVSLPTVTIGVSPLNETAEATPDFGTPSALV